MKLDPKALEAAAKVFASQNIREMASPSDVEGAAEDLRDVILAYLEHPAADLVERSEIEKGWLELMDERDQARAEYSASQEALSEILYNLKDATDERDEARREAARQTLLQEMRATECEGLGKQIASLREVALAVIVETKFSVRPANGEPIVEIINKHGPAHRRLCAALTDTAPEDKA